MVSARPHLWFSNGRAGDAARFYAEHVPDSKVTNVVIAPEGLPYTPAGEFIIDFTVAGMPVTAINAGAEGRRCTRPSRRSRRFSNFGLPPSASNHPAWWTGSVVARSIGSAGWRATQVNLTAETVVVVQS